MRIEPGNKAMKRNLKSEMKDAISKRQKGLTPKEEDPADVQLIALPDKLANLCSIKNAEKNRIVLNAYEMNVKEAVREIYKFELKFTGTMAKDDKKRDLSIGPKNDMGNQRRHRMLWNLYSQMIRKNEDTFGGEQNSTMFVYDCGINFYSLNDLKLKTGEFHIFSINQEILDENTKIYLGKNIKEITAEVRACQTIDIQSRQAIEESRDRSVIQFLEILTSQMIHERGDYCVFNNKFYEKDRKAEIRLQGDPRVLKPGMEKNVRLIGDSVREAVPIVQLDAKKSAFFPAMPLPQFLDEFLMGRDELARKIYSGNNLQKARDQCKGLTVRTTHMRNNRTFAISSLTDVGADRLNFDFRGMPISVEKYFEITYAPFRLRHPNLPCAVEKKPKREGNVSDSFYPMEVLEIVEDQRVPRDKCSPQLTEQMIRNCQALPSAFQANIEMQKKKAFITSSNPFFKSYGVKVCEEIMSANAEVLHPPAIYYSDRDRDEADAQGRMNWKMNPHRRYFIGAKAPKIWVAVILQHEAQERDVMEFLKRIVASANSRGVADLQMPTRYDTYKASDIDSIREKFQFYRANGVEFVIFFTKDKTNPVHHTFKLMEVEFVITTQHICGPTLQKALGDRGAHMVIDNILLKFNLKLGGVNHAFVTSRAFSAANSNLQRDIVKDDWFAKGIMYMGLDMSHSRPQSLYERQANVAPSTPTFVGMAYNLVTPCEMNGTYWMQTTRVTYIQSLKEHVVAALHNYNAKVGRYPSHLVVYRAGVSEGEYRIVLDKERVAFTEAFEEIEQKNIGGFKLPGLTIVVVQKDSNYRIVPTVINERDRPPDQNVRPGTCCDRKIMHPALTEFLLVPHKAIQGTAKPIRCTVIADSHPRIPLEKLENITNSLCYAHGIVTSPVSVPAQLYAAADLSKRAHNNYNSADTSGMERTPGGEESYEAATDQFYNTLSQRLKPMAPHKFWA